MPMRFSHRHLSLFEIFSWLILVLVVQKEEVCAEIIVAEELVKVAALLLGGAARATHAVGKATNLAHLENVVLLFRSDVFQHLGYEFGAHAALDGLEHTKGVGDGRLAYAHHVALLDGLRGFHRYAIHRHLTFLASISRDGAGLV